MRSITTTEAIWSLLFFCSSRQHRAAFSSTRKTMARTRQHSRAQPGPCPNVPLNKFVCGSCGDTHSALPLSWRMVRPDLNEPPEAFIFSREGELCTVGDDYFILANIHFPLANQKQCFVWTCWISLSAESFRKVNELWDKPGREDQAAAFGWLCSALPTCTPTTLGLKTNVQTRPVGERPWVELEPTEHPLAVEQREGIGWERIAAIYHAFQE